MLEIRTTFGIQGPLDAGEWWKFSMLLIETCWRFGGPFGALLLIYILSYFCILLIIRGDESIGTAEEHVSYQFRPSMGFSTEVDRS